MLDWIRENMLLCLLAVAWIGTVFWLLTKHGRAVVPPGWALPISILHVAFGVLCVKLFAKVEAGDFSSGGMSLFGAVFLLPAAYWIGALITRRKPEKVFDVFVIPMVFTLACARVNCLFAGCCLGKVITGTNVRWPTREAELVFYAILLFWLIRRTKKSDPKGILYPAYMAAYGCFRFIVEFFRENSTAGIFHLAHLWALLCAAVGFAFLIELKRRTNAKKATTGTHRRKTK